MADISKCKGQEQNEDNDKIFICPLRDECHRYTAKSSQWQSYFMNLPYENDDCEYFYPIETKYDITN